MDLLISSDPRPLNFHMLLHRNDMGQVVASVAEWANCQVTAATKEEAIALLQSTLRDRLAEVEILPLEVSGGIVSSEQKNPWTEFIGMYEGDADFAEIMAEIRAERSLDETNLDR